MNSCRGAQKEGGSPSPGRPAPGTKQSAQLGWMGGFAQILRDSAHVPDEHDAKQTEEKRVLRLR